MAGVGSLPPEKKILALGGFVMLGLTPSFMDWQQSPEKHKQFILFYAAAIGMFYIGLLS